MNENSLKNLKPYSAESARINGRKGGLKSVESKKEQKMLKEQIREALYLPVKDESIASKLIEQGFEPTYAGMIISNAFQKAGKNAMMMRVLLELIGELKPQSAVAVTTNINPYAGLSEEELRILANL